MAIRPTPTGPKAPPRAQVDAIIRRYLKPDQTPNWRAEFPLYYGLWKRYPSVAFWTHHELPFPLNSLAWFLTEQGKATLESDWVVFHYVPPAVSTTLTGAPAEESPPPAAPSEARGVDTLPQPAYTVPAPPVRPRTVADFLNHS